MKILMIFGTCFSVAGSGSVITAHIIRTAFFYNGSSEGSAFYAELIAIIANNLRFFELFARVFCIAIAVVGVSVVIYERRRIKDLQNDPVAAEEDAEAIQRRKEAEEENSKAASSSIHSSFFTVRIRYGVYVFVNVFC